jgi:hypothetical protein
MLVQRIRVHKRSSAGSAEELCLQRFRKGKTGGTNRNFRKVCERLFANPTIVREDKVEGPVTKA